MRIYRQEAAEILIEYLLRKHEEATSCIITFISTDDKIQIISSVRGVSFDLLNTKFELNKLFQYQLINVMRNHTCQISSSGAALAVKFRSSI